MRARTLTVIFMMYPQCEGVTWLEVGTQYILAELLNRWLLCVRIHWESLLGFCLFSLVNPIYFYASKYIYILMTLRSVCLILSPWSPDPFQLPIGQFHLNVPQATQMFKTELSNFLSLFILSILKIKPCLKHHPFIPPLLKGSLQLDTCNSCFHPKQPSKSVLSEASTTDHLILPNAP